MPMNRIRIICEDCGEENVKIFYPDFGHLYKFILSKEEGEWICNKCGKMFSHLSETRTEQLKMVGED